MVNLPYRGPLGPPLKLFTVQDPCEGSRENSRERKKYIKRERERELKGGNSREKAQGRKLKRESSREGAQERELKRNISSKGGCKLPREGRRKKVQREVPCPVVACYTVGLFLHSSF